MFCIAYFSTASVEPTGADLHDILDISRSFNLHHGITGVLGYFDRSFFQIIEGERVLLECLFDRIQADPRHKSVISVYQSDIESRSFTDWSMALVTPQTLGPEREAFCVGLETLKPHLNCSHREMVTMIVGIFNLWIR